MRVLEEVPGGRAGAGRDVAERADERFLDVRSDTALPIACISSLVRFIASHAP